MSTRTAIPTYVTTETPFPEGLFEKDGHLSVFTIGPSVRGRQEPHPFRENLTKALGQCGVQFTVVSPEIDLSKIDLSDEEWMKYLNNLQDREVHAYTHCSVVAANLDLSADHPGVTTRTELVGMLSKGQTNIVIWAPTENKFNRDILQRAKKIAKDNSAIKFVTNGNYDDMSKVIIAAHREHDDDIHERSGKFDAIELTTGLVANLESDNNTPFVGNPRCFNRRIRRALMRAKSAVYAHIPVHKDSTHLQAFIQEFEGEGFKFYYATETEMVYYKWMGKGEDSVPQYSTAIQGGFSIVLSPNHKQCMLVKPHAKKVFGFAGGAVNQGETADAAASRELREEAGIEGSSASLLIGGYCQSDSREYGWQKKMKMNDDFYIWVFTADPDSESGKIKVQDTDEIETARWFQTDYLIDVASNKEHEDRGQFNPWNLDTLRAFIESGSTPETRYGLTCETWTNDWGQTKTQFQAPVMPGSA